MWGPAAACQALDSYSSEKSLVFGTCVSHTQSLPIAHEVDTTLCASSLPMQCTHHLALSIDLLCYIIIEAVSNKVCPLTLGPMHCSDLSGNTRLDTCVSEVCPTAGNFLSPSRHTHYTELTPYSLFASFALLTPGTVLHPHQPAP